MATSIYSASPQVILEGIKDLSRRDVRPDPEAAPQHLPLFYTFAETGSPDEVKVVTGSSLVNTYGTKLLDPLSEYATHATPFIQGLNSISNLMMIKRLKPTGASTAFIRFSLGISKAPITKVERDRRGRPIIDAATGRPKIVDTGREGYVLKWYTNSSYDRETLISSRRYDDDEDKKTYIRSLDFGKGLTTREVGLLTEPVKTLGAGITTSGIELEHVYPIFDLEVSHFGEYGNNLGVRLHAPNMLSATRPDLRFFENTAARPFSIEFVKRKNRRSPARSVSNLYGEATTSFVFKRGQVNPLLGNEDMFLGTRVLDQYRNLDTTGGRVETYGPFNAVKVYDENINHILSVLYAKELEVDEEIEIQAAAEIEKLNAQARAENKHVDTTPYLPGNAEGTRLLRSIEGVDDSRLHEELKWQLDILTGMSINGYPYRSIRVLDMRNDAKVLDETTEHWAVGGSDGVMTNEEYNRLVSNELQAFDDVANPMLDLARYPFTTFYDTGYPLDIKQDILTLIRARKDVSVCLSTHEVPTTTYEFSKDGLPGVKILSRSEEASILRVLYGFAAAYPESEVYNTGACRANIIMQCGTIIGNAWKGKVPMTYELAMKRGQFMGDPSGKMTPGYGYDQDGIKQLRFMKEVNNPFVPQVAKEINWTHGATWCQYYDRNTMFFPAVRTIYKDETSVLLSDINMLIATDLEKVCFRTWRRLVGNAKLTNAQFAALSDQYILEDTEGRYDGRVVIKPYTYYTPADELRGFSWHCEIHMYANNMKTVGIMTVVTHRMEDLEGGN